MDAGAIIGRRTALTGRRAERAAVDDLLSAVRAGESRALVVLGEPGIGKTALLGYVAEQASDCRVTYALGVQSEVELAFAGLHQLLAPLLDHLDALPAHQRDALRTAFWVSPGPPPDRFLIGLAVLTLLSEAAAAQPVVCLVDDHQWLDRASAQVVSFVARRLQSESVAMILAARAVCDDFAALPTLTVEGLSEADAGALLDSVLTWPLDPGVRDQLVRETRGNPLALLELPRGLSAQELAGGFGFPGPRSVSNGIEESFRRQLEALPAAGQRLLRVIAAEPTGDPALVWRAAECLGIGSEAATPLIEAGLIEVDAHLRFRHPLLRSAVYRFAPLKERQDVHRALAAVTDSALDPERRAWHRAHAAPGPDEDVAEELERSAGRAQARGGLAAAAAFLERAAILTPQPQQRTRRLLAAARTKRDAGAPDAALALLRGAEAGPLDTLQVAEVERLRGQIAFDQRHTAEAAALLLSAAARLGPLDPWVAREAHFEALGAAIWSGIVEGPGGVRDAARAARRAPPAPEAQRAVDVVLDAIALRLTEGHAAAAPLMARALQRFVGTDTADADRWLWLAGSRINDVVALELWDADAWHELASRQVAVARDTGALAHLQFTLALLALTNIIGGRLGDAALLSEEDRAISEATGNPSVGYPELMLAAFSGNEGALARIDTTIQRASDAGLTRVTVFANYLKAVLCNGLGRHDAARDAASHALKHDVVGNGPLIVAELGEAASRTADIGLVEHALAWITEPARVTQSEWALGIEARIRALLSADEAAESHYRDSIARLGRTRLRVEHARAHLLYGEWLRRERRRVEAREHLRAAHEMLAAMGVNAFAERARRELLATGQTVRKRTWETSNDLTAQETRIALLAREGLSNPEIATRLFISPRTVQYHLHKVFAKLGIRSRVELAQGLPGAPDP
jgi:DNA-binding CsgD family transcriptional regulator